jgi:hypothetical protein
MIGAINRCPNLKGFVGQLANESTRNRRELFA